MTLSAHSMQYLNQQGGMLTHVEIEDNGQARAYKLVPTTHWHNGNKFPYEVEKDLRRESFRETTIQGLNYYLVPESTTNAVGRVTPYARPVPDDTIPTQQVRNAEPPAAVKKYLKAEDRKIRRLGTTEGK